jgi:hypothetical protein
MEQNKPTFLTKSIKQNQLVRASPFVGKPNLVHECQVLLVRNFYEISSRNEKVLNFFNDVAGI